MTVEELADLKTIADAVSRIDARLVRIEQHQETTDKRLDAFQRLADKGEGAITFGKWLASFIGVGGVAALLMFVANKGG